MNKQINVLFLNEEAVSETESMLLGNNNPETWSLYFAEDTIKAMSIINRNKIDVVVAEIKDPEKDSRFLLNLKLKHPGIGRIVLSGNNWNGSPSLAWPIAQELKKPYSTELLKTKIEMVITTNDLIK